MGVASLVSDISRAIRKVRRSRYAPQTKIRLVYDYSVFRLRSTIGYHFASTRRTQSFLGYKVHYLDPSFFHTNVFEVFLDEDYFFTSDEPTPVIVDCGSNVGLAVLYFKYRYPKAKILAFEPQPRVFETLRRNVEANGLADVTLFNAALTGTGQKEITIYHAAGVPGDMRATTVRGIADVRSQPLEAVVVDAIPLSSVLPERVDLLKIDVEGAEVEILKELGETLGRVRQLFLEIHCNSSSQGDTLTQVFGILEGAGFHCLVHSNLGPSLHDKRDSYYTMLIYAYGHDKNARGVRPV